MRIKHTKNKMFDVPPRLPAAIINAPVLRWAFLGQRQNGETIFIDADGFCVPIKFLKFWDGTASQARAEARRRGEKFGNMWKEKLKSVTYQKLDPKHLNDPKSLQTHLDRLNKVIGMIQARRKNGQD